jgi:membrane protease YdiL (CAAX protease family)
VAVATGTAELGLVTIGAVYVAAYQEEVIFRDALPRWLSRRLSRSNAWPRCGFLIAGVTSQLTFAVAHWPATAMDLNRAVALLSIGLFMLSLKSVVGLGIVGAVHAFMNLSVMKVGFGYIAVPLWETVAICVIAVAVYVYTAGGSTLATGQLQAPRLPIHRFTTAVPS